MGVGRKLLAVDPLQQGAFPTYELDINVAATIVSSNGAVPESRVFGSRVVVPTFTVASNPTLKIEEARRRRFNAIDRCIQKARQEIMAQEDGNIFSAVDAASSVENSVQDITDTGMLKRDLIEIKSQIDKWDLYTTKFCMHMNEYNDILRWGSGGGQGTGGGDFDPVSMREVWQTGLVGKIWGCDVIVSKMVPAGTVYGLSDPDFVGVMPVFQDIEVLPADEPKKLSLGWVVSEIIGIGILNARGVACGRKSAAVG